jgi:hypothetical protein
MGLLSHIAQWLTRLIGGLSADPIEKAQKNPRSVGFW